MAIAVTFAIVSSAAAETLRLSDHGTSQVPTDIYLSPSAPSFRIPRDNDSNIPTNTHLWISEIRGKNLETATLRNAEGTIVPLEIETLQTSSFQVLYHLRPDQELKGNVTYTLELQVLGRPLETLSFVTNASRDLIPPMTAQPFAASVGSAPRLDSNGTRCPQIIDSYVQIKGAPSTGAALYLLEHSLTGSQYAVAHALRTPEFTGTESGWYRIRPVSTAGLSPANLPSRYFELPASYESPCSGPEGVETIGCSTTSTSSGGLLVLGLLLLLTRRRRASAAR